MAANTGSKETRAAEPERQPLGGLRAAGASQRRAAPEGAPPRPA